MAGRGDNPFEVLLGGEGPKLPKLPKLPVGGVGAIVVLALAAWLLFSSVYTVKPEERGVVLRFGKLSGAPREPGLNFKLPFGVDRVYKVAVQRQQKEEFGFRTLTAGVRSETSTQGAGGESNMLTGDLNAAVVEWVVQYRIEDSERYLFRVRNVTETLRDMSEATMRQVVGDRTVNEVLTVGRQEVADLVEQKLQALCNQYENGIKIEQVVLQDVNPPDPVKPSFNQVNEAQQERERLINQAQSEFNKVVPRARGEAQQTIQAAEGYALDRVNRARGEVARFNSVYEEYRKAPEVTRRRIYLESVRALLPKAGKKIVVDDQVRGILPLLNLDSGSGPGTPRRKED